MKHKVFLIILMTLALFSCSESNQSSSINPSSIEESPSSSEVINIEFDEIVETEEWDDNINQVLSLVIGKEYSSLVPQANAENYKAVATKDEASQIDIVIINCYGILTGAYFFSFMMVKNNDLDIMFSQGFMIFIIIT